MTSPLAKLGPHEILKPIGAGGAEEVYDAREAKSVRDAPTSAFNAA